MAMSLATLSSPVGHKSNLCSCSLHPSNTLQCSYKSPSSSLSLKIKNNEIVFGLNIYQKELFHSNNLPYNVSSTLSRKFICNVTARTGGRPPGPRPRPRPSQNSKQFVEENKGDAPLINEQIRVPSVRLIGEDQAMLGVYPISEALFKAVESSLDLVMIAPEADPPVVRIMDYSKFRYEMQKKKREQQKKALASRQEVKELKMRYNIDTHDYSVRLRAAQRFLGDGDKVKVTMQFRGREMEFKDLGSQLFNRFQTDISEIGIVEVNPHFEGRSMHMVFAPNKAAKAEKDKKIATKANSKKYSSNNLDDTNSDDDDNGKNDDVEEEDASTSSSQSHSDSDSEVSLAK